MDQFLIAQKLFEEQQNQEEEVNESKVIVNEDVCGHINTIIENGQKICDDCGQVLERVIDHGNKDWRYYGSQDTGKIRTHYIRNEHVKSIRNEIINDSFPEKIINKADEIYLKATGSKILRGKNRKQIIFGCLYYAYIELNIPETPETISNILGISKREALSGLKYLNKNYKLPKNFLINKNEIIIKNYILNVLKLYGIQDTNKNTQNKIYKIYKFVENRHSKLKNSRIKTLSYCVCYYYLSSFSKKITISNYSKKIGLSSVTIKNFNKIISGILDKKIRK